MPLFARGTGASLELSLKSPRYLPLSLYTLIYNTQNRPLGPRTSKRIQETFFNFCINIIKVW